MLEKKMVEKTIEICDLCGSTTDGIKCVFCDFVVCFDNKDLHESYDKIFTTYHISTEAGNDVDVCPTCKRKGINKELSITQQPLFDGLREIEALRAESDGYWKEYQKSSKILMEKLHKIDEKFFYV